MNNEEFLTKLSTEVNALAHEFAVDTSQAFLMWVGQRALDLEPDDAFAATRGEGGNDKGIDLFWTDYDSERVFIVQGKYSETGVSNPKEHQLETLLSSTQWLENPEQLRRDGRPELAEIAEEYAEATARSFTTYFWFVYCGRRKTNLEKRASVFDASQVNRDRNYYCQILNLDTLRELYEDATGVRRRVEEATLPLSTERVFEQSSAAYGDALVGTVSGLSLAQLHSQYGDRLFDRNIRLFLGAQRGAVNAGIFETLADEHERSRFWAYNNGLTVVCDRFDYDKSTSTLTLKNFSIVNGCQTTVALARNVEDLDDQVQVLVKVISPPETVIDPIIRFTNSQNQIKVWDVFTQDRRRTHLFLGTSVNRVSMPSAPSPGVPP